MRNILLYLFLITSIFSVQGQEIVKPNVIIFYTDDLGWQDTELNFIPREGLSEPLAETPNMLSLAAEGAKFSNAYSPAPTCAPSRGGLLSGKHPAKTNLIQVSGGELPALKKAKAANKLMAPFFPKRMALEEYTIAEAMSAAGYKTDHIGKWHVEGANNFPVATDQGFDVKQTSRGMHQNMGDRWEGYATDAEGDPYRIDEDGRPYDAVTEDALAFMESNKDEPFFMYMATWLVHTPIQTRDIALLTYYCEKLGIPVPTGDVDITTGGQSNPYYAAMIATVDWSLGKVVDYLKTTDDPRNPGKKLFETTYIIFSSDNGASEMDGNEIVTDNFPLDEGKTSAKEGGVRVPLVVTGPDIPVAEYDHLANGLDFYPTILSMTGATVDESVFNDLDGGDLYPLLKGESNIVKDVHGNERTDLFWHYPSGDNGKMRSSIRSGGYKLYKVYGEEGNYYEAFELYDANGDNVDHEEMIDVINFMPTTIKDEMIAKLETFLVENDARLPTWNPDYAESDVSSFENLDKVPSIASVVYNQSSGIVTATMEDDVTKAAVSSGHLLYRKNEAKEEWFEAGKVTVNGSKLTAVVPEDAHEVVFNMRDENNFLVLSNKLEIINVAQVTLNVTEEQQKFEPESEDVYAELIGNTTANSAFVQMRTEGGGDGFNINVTAAESVVCNKITFRVRSREGDTANFDITIGDETQSFEYTSTRDADDFYYDFDSPVTFDDTAKTIEFLVTGLTNSDVELVERFRVYDVTFHLDLSSLSIDDVSNDLKSIKIYPNPSKNTFSLSKDVESGVVYNMIGEKVYEFRGKSKNIDVSGLQSGIYLVYVVDEFGSKQTVRLIKE